MYYISCCSLGNIKIEGTPLALKKVPWVNIINHDVFTLHKNVEPFLDLILLVITTS